VEGFIDRLDNASDQIKRVRVVVSDVLELSAGGELGGPDVLYDGLREALGPDTVEVVDVYDEHTATLPTDGDTA